MYKKPCLEEIFAHFEEFFLHRTISCPIIDSSVSYYIQAVSDVFSTKQLSPPPTPLVDSARSIVFGLFFVLALISA